MENQIRVDESRPFFGKYWPKGVAHQLDYVPTTTLPDILSSTAKKYPDSPALWFLNDWMDYHTLKDLTDRFATALYDLGVRKGDVVALHLPNSHQYVIAYYAILTLGAVVTPINPTYLTAEIKHQIKMTKAIYYVGLDALYEHYITPIEEECDFKAIIYTNILDMVRSMPQAKKWIAKVLKKIPSAKVIHPKAISFLDCLKYKPNVPKVSIDASEDPAILMMTGGTTGVPKAAILTNQNCVADSTTCVQALFGQKIPGREKLLGHKTGMFGVLPLFHSFAMSAIMNTSIIMGGWIMLFPKPPPTEELLATFDRLPNYNGYVYIAAEILFKRIADLPRKIIDRYQIAGKLELCISGAGPLHEYVRIPFEKKTGAKIREGYGLTEASPVVSCNNFFGDLDPGTVGVPFPGIDWQIFPSDNFDKGPIEISGEEGTGEICISGPIVMKGYYNQPEQTAETIKEWNGRKWLLTGDIGYLDKFGRIVIRDRKKQLIKMAGHSVFPKEVENLIGEHPDVLEVAVAGVPDKKTGEAVKAWIALKPESYEKISVEELKSWMVSNITHWKCPKYVEIVTTIPKSAIGKVMRRSLQESDPLWIEEHIKENSLENSGEELESEQLSGTTKEALV